MRRDAELGGVARQHVDDRDRKRQLPLRTLVVSPLGLARREQLTDVRRAPATTDLPGRGGRCGLERRNIAEMRDIDRDEDVRTIVGLGEIAIKRLNFAPA